MTPSSSHVGFGHDEITDFHFNANTGVFAVGGHDTLQFVGFDGINSSIALVDFGDLLANTMITSDGTTYTSTITLGDDVLILTGVNLSLLDNVNHTNDFIF